MTVSAEALEAATAAASAPAEEVAVEQPQITEQTPAVEAIPAESVSVDTPAGEGGPDVQTGIDDAWKAEVSGYVSSQFDQHFLDVGRSLSKPKEEATPKPAQAATSPSFDLDKLWQALPESEQFDPALQAWTKQARDTVRALPGLFEQRIAAEREAIEKAASQRIETLEKFIQQQEAERFERDVDGFFGALPQEWHGEFGKDGVKSLPPALVNKRNEVIQDAMELRAGMAHYGRTPPPLPELLKRALAIRYSDKQTTFARQQILQQAKTAKNGTAAQAASKRTAPMTGRERGEQAFNEAFAAYQANHAAPVS